MVETVTNAALDALARWMVGLRTDFFPILQAGLFANDVTLTDNMTLAYLGECMAAGYARVDLVGSYWTGATAGGVARYLWPIHTWSITGDTMPATTIYGHFVLETHSGAIWWAGKWETPVTVASILAPGGHQPELLPQWEGEQCGS